MSAASDGGRFTLRLHGRSLLNAPSTPRVVLGEKLATRRGRTLYGRRKAMIEPVFAQHKAVRGFDRFVCRGERMYATEWKLMNTTHNLLNTLSRRG